MALRLMRVLGIFWNGIPPKPSYKTYLRLNTKQGIIQITYTLMNVVKYAIYLSIL